MNSYRVSYNSKGVLLSVEQLQEVPTEQEGKFSCVVVAKSEQEAANLGRAAYRRYCAAKVKARRERYKANNQCRCGRQMQNQSELDRDWNQLRCAVCLEKGRRDRKASRNRDSSVPHVRDEQARLDANASRQRERRDELRIETLMDVRHHWEQCRTVGEFTNWLAGEITKAIGRPE